MFLHVTSQVQGAKHPRLLQEKGGRGFPYLVYMNAEGKVEAKVQGRSVKGFSNLGSNLSKFAELTKKQADGDKTVGKDIWLLKVKMGKFSTGQAARDALKALEGVSDDDKKLLEKSLVDMDIVEVVKGIRRGDRAGTIAAGKKFAGWVKAGRVPSTDANSGVIYGFWNACLVFAGLEKDVTLFEKSLKALKKEFANNQGAANFFKAKEAVLAKMKAEKSGGDKK